MVWDDNFNKQLTNYALVKTCIITVAFIAFGLEGDVDGVDGKTSPAQEEATKVRPKICNTSNLYI